MASHGLDSLPLLRRPLGMSEANFTLLRRQVNAMLSGAAGTAELQRKDYVAARLYLQNAVSVNKNSVRDVYALALADLDGPGKNPKEGYWYLARAVNLSQGTPQGFAIAQYARARYVKDGGSTTDWKEFLASAKPAGSAPQHRLTAMASINPPPPVARPRAESTAPIQTASVKTPPLATPATSQPRLPSGQTTANPPSFATSRARHYGSDVTGYPGGNIPGDQRESRRCRQQLDRHAAPPERSGRGFRPHVRQQPGL